MRIKAPQVCHQTIDGEVVVVNLENGCYYSLLGLSAAIWHHISAGSDRAAIVGDVTHAYAGHSDAGPLTSGFIDQLVANQLVDESAIESNPGVVIPGFTVPFSPPILEKFDDMQDLLLLDPIHEVDNTGWPNKPAAS